MTSKNKTQTPPSQPRITIERVRQYEALMPLLTAMFNEFKELSKKKPDGVLNRRKVELVNRLLKDVLVILEDQPSRAYLDLFDEDDMPQNSDVLLMLSQFHAAMQAFRDRYYGLDSTRNVITWRTE